MRRSGFWWSGAGPVLAALVAATPLAAQAPSLTVSAVRFYRSDKQTTVKAFVEVPAGLGESSASGGADSVHYGVGVRVIDSAGVTLYRESWNKALLNEPGAAGVDIVEFVVPAGKYRLEASVLNAAGQPKAQSATVIQAYATPPDASDLLLAPMMRVAQNATDTVPGPGEMRRGNTLIAAAATLHLTPLRTRAYYLLEAYNHGELDQTGSMQVAVLDSASHTLTQTPPVAVRIGPGGGVLQGQLDLEGLPEGRYTMRVTVDRGGSKVERSATFTMAPLATTVARNAELTRAARTTDEGFFADMSEAQLDSAATPLLYLANSSERSLIRGFDKLTPTAKRRFLVEFWRKRDPDSTSQQNAVRARFYQAIEFANRNFAEAGRRAQPGWKTDRGRIYAKNGAPDDVLQRPSGSTLPYEVWRYTRGRSRYYVFADRTGTGNYNLLKTNDINEPTFPGWREILKEDAVQDIGRYVGEDFYRDVGGSGAVPGS
ncbi:MAG TPA: GWxTD domain-containing protein [Gemmatimonadales bacterium]|nr:GWxTD domain-containing protein [Gemmatimonadales bacterium]